MPAKRDRQRKDQVRLKNPLEKRIKDYSLAAVGIGAVAFAPAQDYSLVAAGIAAAAFAPGANASVTALTMINHPVMVGSTYPVMIGTQAVMSINNSTDGIEASVIAILPNGVKGWGHTVGALAEAPVALNAAIKGTSLASFNSSRVLVRSIFGHATSHYTAFVGTHFIGFSFGSGATLHYGWVELNITQPGGPGTAYAVTVIAAAYENTAGQFIAAGATTDSSSPSPSPAPNSLWLLALGAAGIAGLELLRRRRTA